MRKSISILLLIAGISSLPALADPGGAILGTIVGAGTGSALGYQINGRHGAAVGAALGGVVGAVIGDQARHERVYVEPAPVMVRPVYYPETPVIYAPRPVAAPVVYVQPYYHSWHEERHWHDHDEWREQRRWHDHDHEGWHRG
jgi:hypothetical protein